VKAEPSKFGHLKEMIDQPHGVSKAHHALRRAQDQQRVLSLKLVPGKFKTLVIDPPWPAEVDFLGRAMPQYSLMTREEILAVPVAEWAEDNAHLYLWVTNSNVPLACECMKAWGFQHKTMLTWAKPRYGLGKMFRGQTEHVFFGIKGRLGTRCTNISTLFHAPTTGHSAKPEKFYEIVRAASYPPYGEAFQRTARPDFVNLYEQRPASEAAE
jgi:N6-adenosine-specific RNA methylase IME4